MKKSVAGDLARALSGKISGEVTVTLVDRTLYSTDASNYRILPQAVAIPKTARDVATVVGEAAERSIPVTVRGAGTSLAGQAVGEGMILDLSKYMNGVLEIDPEGKKVRVGPGITIDALNEALFAHGLMFGPDPSSSAVATVGGAVANNATGAHSILYGMAGDHVVSSNVVLADGKSAELSRESYQRLKKNGRGTADDLLERLAGLVEKSGEVIEKEFPKHWRRASGYSLDRFLEKDFNPAKLLASSEGTLAVSTDFELNLVERPLWSALCVLRFDEIPGAMKTVPEILSKNPSAVELIDGTLIGLARKNRGFAHLLSFIEGTPEAVLVVEFQEEDEKRTRLKAIEFSRFMESAVPGSRPLAVLEPDEQKKVWDARKAGLGILMSENQRRKPVPCIEDVSIPAERLAGYIEEVISLLGKFGLTAAFYGHASAGCVHVRPLIDLGTEKGVSEMTDLCDGALELALRNAGVMSGEHGDGLQRSYLNERLFGRNVYSIMKELKRVFDPEGILNPGKIVDGPQPTQNLRAGETRSATRTVLDWSRQGGLAAAAGMCNGQGVCRKTAGGVMCPSYRATLDERDTTRARANALRELLSGNLPEETLFEKEFYEVFDLCVGCKACATECPSGVDVGKMKTEYLARYKAQKGFTMRDRLFGRAHEISLMRSALPSFVNRALEGSVSRTMLSLAGVHPARPLPRMASETFSGWFGKRRAPDEGEPVVYFHDTWSEFFYPGIARAVTRILEKLGFQVILERRRKCCGRPMLSCGMVEKARENARSNVSVLSEYAERNVPVIFSEPSCLSAFRDEYRDLLPENESLEAVVATTRSLCEFVLERAADIREKAPVPEEKKKVLVHGHCHEVSGGKFDKTLSLLRNLGYDARGSDAGCCGMAGGFGHEKEHYEISRTIGEKGLFPKIRTLDEGQEVCVTGFSCMEQISHFTEKPPVHVALILEESVAGGRAE